MLLRIVLGLLAIWLVLAIIGFIVKTLFWLAIVGIVLFVGTVAFGAGKRSSLGGRNRRAL